MANISDKYKIIEPIATGGMATIYKGVQISLGREVVIKKLHPHLAEDAKFVRRFKREAAILAKLQHKNIVSIIDFFESDNDLYIVLEYIKGYTLTDIIKKRKRIQYKTALYILDEVCHGLEYIHSNHILHRDLKPDNIMISESGEVKISDFGLAYRRENMNITNPGTYIGTPSYFPPEQLMGKPLKPTADIFSLGVSFVEMLTGKNPFVGEKEFDAINNILYLKSINIKFKGKKPPSQITKLIYSMMEKSAEKRIQSCDNIISVINKFAPSYTKKDFYNFLKDNEKTEDEYNLSVSISTKKDIYRMIVLVSLFVVFIIVSLFQVINYVNSRIPETVFVEVPSRDNFVMHIDTYPSNAEISINDSLMVRTPMNLTMDRGAYRIKSVDDGFEEYETLFVLQKNDTLKFPLIKIEIRETYGYLDINVIPWADLYIDNVYVDRTPIEDHLHLRTGIHELKLIHPNRKILILEINIIEDSIMRIDKELEKAYGYLKVIVRPWADVYVDDSLIGTTPIADSLYLLIGPHKVTLKHPDNGEINDNVIIKEKEVLRKLYSY